MGGVSLEFILNLVLIMLLGAPLLLLHFISPKIHWLEDNEDWLSIVVWLLALTGIYLIVAPLFGMEPATLHCNNHPNNIFCNPF